MMVNFRRLNNIIMKQNSLLRLMAIVLVVAMSMGLISCSNNDKTAGQTDVSAIADKVWDFSQTHPDGFTLDIRTMTEPTEGIAVSYAATQSSHSRSQLDKVVAHALQNDGFVGGWYNSSDGLYYFDSTRLFPENQLKEAIEFGKKNGQNSAFILSSFTEIPLEGKVAEIVNRGMLIVGTTGDYRPLSFRENDGS